MHTTAISSRPLYKHPRTNDTYRFNLTAWLCKRTIQTVGGVSVQDAPDDALTITDVTKENDYTVSATIGGGTNLKDYHLLVEVTASDGNTIAKIFPLRIRKQ